MIKSILDDGESSVNSPSALALGKFDGVHLGHQYLINDMLRLAGELRLTPTVCTFAPHPDRYHGLSINLITTYEQKLAVFDRLGVECCFLTKFDAQFAALSPQSFMEDYLLRRLKGKAIVVGNDFRFGKNRAGDVETLRNFCGKHGIILSIIPKVQNGDTIISSSVIRTLVMDGAVDKVPYYLGRYISVIGEVIHGDKLGSSLGAPTANLRLESELLPPDGVYAGYIESDSQELPVMIYIGSRPTIGNALERRFEVNIIGEDRGDLYGKRLEVFITAFLRHSKKFDSLEELKAAIQADQERILNYDYIRYRP